MNQTTSKKSNISSRRTCILLKTALFQLMASTPFERITLTDICTASMVPRSTFYRYFEDKYDLLHFCLRGLIEDVGLTEDVICFRNTESIRDFLLILISHINENMQIYRKIYLVNRDGELMKILQDGLKRILTEKLTAAEEKGYHARIPYPVLTTMLSDFYFSIIRCYLELADQYDLDSFIESICRFSERDLFETGTGPEA